MAVTATSITAKPVVVVVVVVVCCCMAVVAVWL